MTVQLNVAQLRRIADILEAVEGVDLDDAANPTGIYIEGPIPVATRDDMLGNITSTDGFWAFEPR